LLSIVDCSIVSFVVDLRGKQEASKQSQAKAAV